MRQIRRAIIGCEFSGAVRRALRAIGIDAYSCDILPAEDGDDVHHLQGDIIQILRSHRGWDLGIFHPPCTYLANSGAKHLYIDGRKENGPNPDRWAGLDRAATFFRALLDLPIPKIAVENPIQHEHARFLIGAEPTQIIQPWMFGHKEMKATCLWLKGLPKLQPTNIVGPPPKNPEERKAWARVHRESPGPDRWKNRSRTFEGIAAAMADQWGRL